MSLLHSGYQVGVKIGFMVFYQMLPCVSRNSVILDNDGSKQ